MTCLNPMFAKRSAVPNANGKYELSNFVSYRDLSGKSLDIAKSELANNYAANDHDEASDQLVSNRHYK